MGEYNNETVTLALDNLPQHSQVTVAFDLLILRSWDGNQRSTNTLSAAEDSLATIGDGVIGPDVWSLKVDNEPLLTTTFSNWDAYGFRQAYPGSYPGGDYPARTGAQTINSLCYTFATYNLDSIYHMRYTIPHSAGSLKLDFSASGLQPIDDESWGLDNVRVSVSSGADLMPYRLFLPKIGK
jgi:hypothetical protein